MTSPAASVLIVDYEDLQNDPKGKDNPILGILAEAFGKDGSGILAVRNCPGFVEAKSKLLPMAHDLINLPADYLESKLTDPGSLYNAGWSLGKEKLGDGEPDFAKGSFYYNPCTDKPGSELDRKTYPLSYPCNIWPDDKLPALEPAAKELGLLLKNVTVDLARHLDVYLQATVGTAYTPNTLYHAMKDTEKVKGRLLYYYPKKMEDENNGTGEGKKKKLSDSWIGWHNDSGFLTALAGDIYLDHTTGKLLEACPDDQAGLYVADREDNIRRVVIPSDCLAIQMGECTQILSGGAVCATPHWVRAAERKDVARISLAAFVDTPPDFQLVVPSGSTKDSVCHSDQQSKRVPPLDQRWTEDGMTFGDFLTKTFQMYYDWTAPS